MRLKAWIEAMRLRTLPVSVAGVLCAIGFSLADGTFSALPAAMCFIFAVLAQISSNFANEYYDFKGGLDKAGRIGPRRGVTEGDIKPEAMKTATFGTLAAACAVGCSLIYWGGFWLLPAGIFIALGVLAYSTGPYPLSHHALGEVAVIFFFGLIPVNLTYYIMSCTWTAEVACGSLSMGLMGANVLIVNNYRDADDDRAVGKRTLAVVVGRPLVSMLYFVNGFIAVGLMAGVWLAMSVFYFVIPLIYLSIHIFLSFQLIRRKGAALNPLLGMTAMAMLFYAAVFAVTELITHC